MTSWYTQTSSEVGASLDVDLAVGLPAEHASNRLLQCGPNELFQVDGRGGWRILWEQISGAMVVLLVVAAAVSAVLGEYTDAVVIITIVLINAGGGLPRLSRRESIGGAEKVVRTNRARTTGWGCAGDVGPRTRSGRRDSVGSWQQRPSRLQVVRIGQLTDSRITGVDR